MVVEIYFVKIMKELGSVFSLGLHGEYLTGIVYLEILSKSCYWKFYQWSGEHGISEDEMIFKDCRWFAHF